MPPLIIVSTAIAPDRTLWSPPLIVVLIATAEANVLFGEAAVQRRADRRAAGNDLLYAFGDLVSLAVPLELTNR